PSGSAPARPVHPPWQSTETRPVFSSRRLRLGSPVFFLAIAAGPGTADAARAVMIESEPISLWFYVPASDPLGREEVHGKVRFLPDLVELHWRMKGNVFRGADGGMARIELPY